MIFVCGLSPYLHVSHVPECGDIKLPQLHQLSSTGGSIPRAQGNRQLDTLLVGILHLGVELVQSIPKFLKEGQKSKVVRRFSRYNFFYKLISE